jgi:hypothetical protein
MAVCGGFVLGFWVGYVGLWWVYSGFVVSLWWICSGIAMGLWWFFVGLRWFMKGLQWVFGARSPPGLGFYYFLFCAKWWMVDICERSWRC